MNEDLPCEIVKIPFETICDQMWNALHPIYFSSSCSVIYNGIKLVNKFCTLEFQLELRELESFVKQENEDATKSHNELFI